MRAINKIIVHCSDSDADSHDDISIIRQWHLKRGFSGVGYHYFIQKDGSVQDGRKLELTGAHCKGENAHSIGVCLHGRDSFTVEQFTALRRICNVMCGAFNIDKKEIYGHNHFNKNKTCPNFDVGKVIGVEDDTRNERET